MLILVTGATGKVGRNLVSRLPADSRCRGARVRALCHSRSLPRSERKAKYLPGWQPEYDLERLVDQAWEYECGANDPRVVHHPG